MIEITEASVNAMAPNQSAVVNGWGLVKKGSFVKLCKTADETLLFGECKGSGASSYHTSVDFSAPENPVSRCSCPSRQFPCKHALGLLYAYLSGKAFETAELPPDIAEKREKAEKREEKKKEKTAPAPRKPDKSALAKKLKAQLEGLELLEKMLSGISKSGLGAMNAKTVKVLEEQCRQLGNYYLPGAQIFLREFLLLFKGSQDRERTYTEAVDRLGTLYSLCMKGKEHVKRRLEDPEHPAGIESNLDELLGHTWQMEELKALGAIQTDVELVQLSFNAYVDEARQEYVDTGYWINLSTGQIQKTQTFRPFKAVKYIREEDSCFFVVKANALAVYPGDMNPRIRWDSVQSRKINAEDTARIRSLSQRSYGDVVKAVKNQIKNPLAEKEPVVLLHYEKLGRVSGQYVIEDAFGQRLVLEDDDPVKEPESLKLIHLLKRDVLGGQSMLVCLHHNLHTKKLCVKPLSIVTGDKVIRLAY